MSSRSQAKSGKAINTSGSGSAPDLRTVGQKEVALRKRKYECECTDALAEFRKEMMADFRKEMLSFLQDFTKSQEERSETLHQEIKDIKSEIKNNSVILQSIEAEQNAFKSELDNIKTLTNTLQQKMTLLEDDLSNVKNNSPKPASPPDPISYDATILEVLDRSRREKNVVIIGIPEAENSDVSHRRAYDKTEAMKILTTIFPECPSPRLVLRLGKFIQHKNRPIKVCFESQETAKSILRNKKHHPIFSPRIYADQTLYQQRQIKNLRNELQSRQQKGETNLTIKYFKGVPKIITRSSKNEILREPTSMT